LRYYRNSEVGLALRRLSREEKKAETRKRLLASAEEVFVERGFHGASVEEVAEREGFSIGAVYSNFEGKADLLLALFEEHMTAQSDAYLDAFAAGGSLEERVRGGAARWMQFLREHPGYFPLYLEFAAHAAREPGIRHALTERHRAFRRLFKDLIERGTIDLGFDPDPQVAEEIAVLISALGAGLAIERLADPDETPDDLLGSLLTRVVQALARDWATEGGQGE
jgi:AcrR family transcriptional regulator